MKILRFIAVIIAVYCGLTGCQKTRLPEEQPESFGARNDTTSRDSTTVTPNFDTNDWEDSIDVNFGFGKENEWEQ